MKLMQSLLFSPPIQRLEVIRNKQRDAEKQVRDTKAHLSDSESTLRRARDKLSDKKKEQAALAIAGVAITAIPVIGWIVGPTMVAVSFTAFEQVSGTL